MKTEHVLIKARGMILAVAAALACSLALAPGAALAADGDFAAGPSDFHITAEMQMPAGVAADDVQFDYNFSKVAVNEDTVNLKDMPAIDPLSVTVGSKTHDGTPTQDGSTVTYAKSSAAITLPGPAEFKHAGEFVYSFSESNPNKTNLTSSKAHYNLHIFVINDDTAPDKLSIKSVTVWKTTDDGGSVLASEEKVDPQLDPATGMSGAAFVNKYQPADTSLKVSKAVKGADKGDDYGDRTKKFQFTITITKPDPKDTYTMKGWIYNESDPKTDVGHTLDFTSGTPATFTLMHGQYILFEGLPVGATYNIKEDGASDYTPSATAYTSAVTVLGAGIDPESFGADDTSKPSGSSLAAAYKDGSALILGVDNDIHDANRIEFTNTYKAVSPTGIFVDTLPYVLMVGVPLGCAALYLVVKRRKGARVS